MKHLIHFSDTDQHNILTFTTNVKIKINKNIILVDLVKALKGLQKWQSVGDYF